jgi:hypothetical protein
VVTNGQQPELVGLGFFTENRGVVLQISLSDGEKFDNSSKTSHITVDGPANGWYRISGTVKRAYRGADDNGDWLNAPELKVEGSLACANYGTPITAFRH